MPAPETLLAGVLLASLVLYALLGGADFGGGVWDLLASGPRKAQQRDAIAHALAPIWEVNHIWLILAVVLLFTAFPPAFAAVGESLHVPLTLLLVGIIGRGSAFAFRAFDTRPGPRERWGLVFSVSSLLSPLLLGASVGALASGTLVRGSAWSWLTPFSAVTGAFALALFAFLAATYLCAEAGTPALADDFRRRALAAGVCVAMLAAAVLVLSRDGAPRVFQGLLGSRWALGLHAATGLCAVGAFASLFARRFQWARATAAAQVGLIVLGWGAAQSPYLVVPDLTLTSAAARPATLRAVLFVLPLGAAVLVPSLALLLKVFKRGPSSPA